MEQTLVNRYGDEWIVEHRESERLRHIGGFLMICSNLGCLTISGQIADVDKARGRETLLGHLTRIPIGTVGTVLWDPEDE